MRDKLLANDTTSIQVKTLEATKACPGFDTPHGLIVCTKGELECSCEEFHYPGGRCNHCNGSLYIEHKACSGSGRVYVFNHGGEFDLRMECKNKNIALPGNACFEGCYVCGMRQTPEGEDIGKRRGWTPNDDIAALVECIRGMKWELIIIGSNDKGFCVVNIKPYGGIFEYVANENTFRDALWCAVAQAVEAIQDGLGSD